MIWGDIYLLLKEQCQTEPLEQLLLNFYLLAFITENLKQKVCKKVCE